MTTHFTTNGFTVTENIYNHWACTCGRSGRPGGRPEFGHAAHVAQHNAEGNVLLVSGNRAEGFFDQLVADMADAVVTEVRTINTTSHRGTILNTRRVFITIDPAVMTAAEAVTFARGRGFTAGMVNANVTCPF